MEDIQEVSEDAERKDSYGERVASIATVTTKYLGDDLVMVFCTVSEVCSATLASQQELVRKEWCSMVGWYLIAQQC